MRKIFRWSGHVEKIGGERLARRADSQRVERNSMRGRQRLRWEDVDLERGEEWGITITIQEIGYC